MTFDAIKNLFEGVGSVGVIYYHGKRLAFVDNIHAAFDGIERFDAVYDLLFSEAELLSDKGGGHRIIDIEFAGDFRLYIYITE